MLGELGKVEANATFSEFQASQHPQLLLDWLHCHYLGAAQYIFGSIFWLLVYHLLPADPQNNLLAVWARMQQLYKAYRVQHCYSYFNRLTMFVKKTGGPKLRGRGAEVKAHDLFVAGTLQPSHFHPSPDPLPKEAEQQNGIPSG